MTIYPTPQENFFCSSPADCSQPDVLMVGSAIPLAVLPHFVTESQRRLGRIPNVLVVDAGPMDLLGHMAHDRGFVRHPFVGTPERMGGRLSLWGLSTPRPPVGHLRKWPYDFDHLVDSFESVERELGVHDQIPMSGRHLESRLATRLEGEFADDFVRVAPLAIDRDGNRFCPLQYVPDLVESSCVRLLPRFRVASLQREGERIRSVEGTWQDGNTYSITPRSTVMAVGTEAAIPLVQSVADNRWPLRVADHHRVDLHGWIRPDNFGAETDEELGVAILLLESESRDGTPFHLEVKIAPVSLWRRNFMQSSDNLSARHDDALYVQIQAVAAMRDRIPADDLLTVSGPIHPVMTHRDALLHGEIVQKMLAVSEAVGLPQPTFNFRPLLTNHHCYGAFRVGEAVTEDFRFAECPNLFILPPTSYVDLDDDANPTCKSIVLARYAMDSLISDIAQSDMTPASDPRKINQPIPMLGEFI